MDSLFPSLLLLALGIALIVKGGDLFVDAAVWMAEASGMPKFLVGATVVSLATTLPELMVSVMGVVRGEVDLAVGNAVGSVTANTGLIMGISVVCMPALLGRRQIAPKALLLAAASLSLLLLCRDGTLRMAPGLVLVGIFALFLWENIASAKNRPARPADRVHRGQLPRQLIRFAAGIGAIVWGADLLIDNGSALALALGVPSAVIGVTVIAVGTSLPELVTTVTAIARRESDLSIGNIIGANIIDLTLILPVCSLLSGGSLTISGQGVALDLPACFAIVLLGVVPPALTGRFFRWQGAAMLAAYGAYLYLLVG